jgi:hypothetical protein
MPGARNGGMASAAGSLSRHGSAAPAQEEGVPSAAAAAAGTTRPQRRAVQWDEPTIAEHDKSRGTRQKIMEPKTPYRPSRGGGGSLPPDGDGDGQAALALGTAACGDDGVASSHPMLRSAMFGGWDSGSGGAADGEAGEVDEWDVMAASAVTATAIAAGGTGSTGVGVESSTGERGGYAWPAAPAYEGPSTAGMTPGAPAYYAATRAAGQQHPSALGYHHSHAGLHPHFTQSMPAAGYTAAAAPVLAGALAGAPASALNTAPADGWDEHDAESGAGDRSGFSARRRAHYGNEFAVVQNVRRLLAQGAAAGIDADEEQEEDEDMDGTSQSIEPPNDGGSGERGLGNGFSGGACAIGVGGPVIGGAGVGNAGGATHDDGDEEMQE